MSSRKVNVRIVVAQGILAASIRLGGLLWATLIVVNVVSSLPRMAQFGQNRLQQGIVESYLAAFADIVNLWLISRVLIVLPLIIFPQRLARWILPVPDLTRCPRCQYKAGAAATCPECGHALDDAAVKVPAPVPNDARA